MGEDLVDTTSQLLFGEHRGRWVAMGMLTVEIQDKIRRPFQVTRSEIEYAIYRKRRFEAQKMPHLPRRAYSTHISPRGKEKHRHDTHDNGNGGVPNDETRDETNEQRTEESNNQRRSNNWSNWGNNWNGGWQAGRNSQWSSGWPYA